MAEIDESKVAFIDIETTGLDPDKHDIWEVGVIVDGVDYEWQMDARLERADPGALRINRFYDRHCRYRNLDLAVVVDRDIVAREVARLTSGRMLVGAVPSFDAGFLERFLRANCLCPAWSHRLICVENLVAGALGTLPVGLSKAAEAMGVPVDPAVTHTALGDARLARAVFLAVMARQTVDA